MYGLPLNEKSPYPWSSVMTKITLGEAAPLGRGVAMNKVVIANAIEIVQRRVSRRLEWIQGMVRCGLR